MHLASHEAWTLLQAIPDLALLTSGWYSLYSHRPVYVYMCVCVYVFVLTSPINLTKLHVVPQTFHIFFCLAAFVQVVPSACDTSHQLSLVLPTWLTPRPSSHSSRVTSSGKPSLTVKYKPPLLPKAPWVSVAQTSPVASLTAPERLGLGLLSAWHRI